MAAAIQVTLAAIEPDTYRNGIIRRASSNCNRLPCTVSDYDPDALKKRKLKEVSTGADG